jgi:hypothetical protein
MEFAAGDSNKYLTDYESHSPKDIRSFSVLLIACTVLGLQATKSRHKGLKWLGISIKSLVRTKPQIARGRLMPELAIFQRPSTARPTQAPKTRPILERRKRKPVPGHSELLPFWWRS